MSPIVATAIFVTGIMGLFWLDRCRGQKPSIALWIPTLWLFIACSRSVTTWLQLGAPVDSADQVLEGSPTDRVVFTGLLVLAVFVLVARGRKVIALLKNNKLVAFFFLYCLMSIAWSDFPDVAFKRWTKAFGDLAMIIIILIDADPEVAFTRLVARLSYVLIPLSILFIKYYPQLGVNFGPWGGKAQYVGATTNKNSLGVICLCFGLVALWRLWNTWKTPDQDGKLAQRTVLVTVLAMVIWLLHTANSMTAISTFSMSALLLSLAVMQWTSRRPWIVNVLMVGMLSVSASVLFLGVSPDVLTTMGRDPTLTDRTEVWGVLLSLVTNPLFGTGFESFWLGRRLEHMWTVYWWHPNEAHNGYLEIYINLGWIGIVLLAAVIISGYRTVMQAWQKDYVFGALKVAFFVVGLAYNFTEAAFFRMLAPAWIFFLFAITAVPIVARNRQLCHNEVSEEASEPYTSEQHVPQLHPEAV